MPCPQNGTGVLKGLIGKTTRKKKEKKCGSEKNEAKKSKGQDDNNKKTESGKYKRYKKIITII